MKSRADGIGLLVPCEPVPLAATTRGLLGQAPVVLEPACPRPGELLGTQKCLGMSGDSSLSQLRHLTDISVSPWSLGNYLAWNSCLGPALEFAASGTLHESFASGDSPVTRSERTDALKFCDLHDQTPLKFPLHLLGLI